MFQSGANLMFNVKASSLMQAKKILVKAIMFCQSTQTFPFLSPARNTSSTAYFQRIQLKNEGSFTDKVSLNSFKDELSSLKYT